MNRNSIERKKRVTQENGAVSTLVLFTILMFIVILTGVYFTLSQNQRSQLKSDMRIRDIYGEDVARVEEIYNERITKPYTLPETMGGANAPDISGFYYETAKYVTWNTTSSPYKIQETISINNAPPSGWANYTEKKWANIKTTGGGNDCYWVWIPRYAYCITTGYQSNAAGTIDIKFLRGTTNTPIDGSSITISNSSGSGNWNVHPAFWWDKNNNGIQDEGEQLTGIWVAKYEASSSNVSTINLENETLTGDTSSLAGTGGGTDTSLQVRVKPNVTSWRGLNVNGIFEVCQNLTKTVTINGTQIKNSLADTTNLDSHMMKNTEWGAVAYLSSSKYGKTDSSGNRVRVYNNPYYNGTTNCSPITGLAGTTATQVNDNTTTNLYAYNTQEGIEASTTGNVYGVYDMAGGAWEYVAGIYKGTTSDNLGNNTNRSNLWNSSNSKYVDQYTETTGSQSTYYGNTNKYGDAVFETSSSGGSITGSWVSSYSCFPYSSYPVFLRGGRAGNGSDAGVFAFNCDTGKALTYYSFRPVVLSSQP